jgi:ADP-ribose pyrophosphatase YjhB (NUDIX family)
MQMSEGFWKKYNNYSTTSSKYSTYSTQTRKNKYYNSNDDFFKMSHYNKDGYNETSSILFDDDDDIKEKYVVENRTYNNTNTQQYCNNCGKHGHLFSSCVVPITSLGIIACRKKSTKSSVVEVASELDANIIDGTVSTVDENEISSSSNNQFEYLMIQRVDSFGYIEFMRGKYSIHNYGYLRNIIDEMTVQEKQNILTKPFDELWVSLWGEYSGLQYRGEQQLSKNKYLQLKTGIKWDGVCYNLESLVTSSITQWDTAEWGFPKGRRNHQEKDIDCAFREFTEETGYNKDCLKQIFNILPYEEIFIGSNMKCYKNKYFLCYMNANSELSHSRGYQTSEVKNMKWLSYDECMSIIRPYNVEKKNMLTSINNTLHKFYICNI